MASFNWAIHNTRHQTNPIKYTTWIFGFTVDVERGPHDLLFFGLSWWIHFSSLMTTRCKKPFCLGMASMTRAIYVQHFPNSVWLLLNHFQWCEVAWYVMYVQVTFGTNLPRIMFPIPCLRTFATTSNSPFFSLWNHY